MRKLRVYCMCDPFYGGSMLTIFRRHLTTCKHREKGRKHRTCGCPLAVEGTLRGEYIRKTLDIRSWEGGQKLIREWEVNGMHEVVVPGFVTSGLADCSDMVVRSRHNDEPCSLGYSDHFCSPFEVAGPSSLASSAPGDRYLYVLKPNGSPATS